MATPSTPIRLGGAISCTNGNPGVLTFGPLLPGDRLDQLVMYLATGNDSFANPGLYVGVVMGNSPPLNATDYANRTRILLADSKLNGTPYCVDQSVGAEKYVDILEPRIPLLAEVDQSSRYVSVQITSTDSRGWSGSAYLDVFRPPAE